MAVMERLSVAHVAVQQAVGGSALAYPERKAKLDLPENLRQES
mgnify:CR=1|jgi:hypothetical protein